MTKIKPLSFLFAAEVLLLMAIAYAQPVHALTAPKNLTANVASTTQINLKWDRVLGASSYRVFRASKQIATVRGTTFSNINLTPNTTYSYNVAAVDTRWRQSPLSNTATATTLTDTNPPPTTTAEVGYLGCSMTMAAVNGALNLGMTNIWNTKPEYGGGGISQWKDPKSKWWNAFQTAYNAQPVNVIWWELCAVDQTKTDETYENALLILDELKRRIPGVTVYVSAQPAYNPSSHECAIAGVGGQSRMASIAAQLVSAGEAITGPTQGPLEYPSQVKSDGCHPVASGEQVLGKQLMDFFLTKPSPNPAPTVGSTAHGLFVVDDGRPEFTQALSSQYVDGALVRVRWESLEPTEGAYNFKPLCDKIAQAHKAGKSASIVNYTLTPKWLLAKVPINEQWSFNMGRTVTVVNPWNQTQLDAMKKLATAEANYSCEGFPIKSHPSVTQIDTGIAGSLSIRDKPTTATQDQMNTSVMSSIQIWRDAFAIDKDWKAYYVSAFPYRDKTVDASKIVANVLAKWQDQHLMVENFDVMGVGDTTLLKMAKHTIIQDCNYFSQPNLIKCSGSGVTGNTPKAAFDKVLKPLGNVRSVQIYPVDIIYPAYSEEIKYIHKQVNQ